jgi:hypothetical protein
VIDNFRIYDFVLDRVWARGRELSACALRIALGGIRNDWKIELIQPIAGETPHARFMLLVFFKTCGAQIVFAAEIEDEIIGYRRSCTFPAAAQRRYEK